MRPFPSLIQGVLRTEESIVPIHAPLTKSVRLVLGWASRPLDAAAHLTARLLGIPLYGHWCLQLQMLLLTALLLAASWASSMAYNMRNLIVSSTGNTKASYLLRQAEASGIQLAAWGEISKFSSLLGLAISILQAVAFLVYFGLFLLVPAIGHVMVESLAEFAGRQYELLQHQLPHISAWHNQKAPRQSALYWRLPEDAMLGDLFEAMREDVAYIAMVNAALTQPKQRADLSGMMSPAKPPPPSRAEHLLAPSPGATPLATSSINPLFSEHPSPEGQESLSSSQGGFFSRRTPPRAKFSGVSPQMTPPSHPIMEHTASSSRSTPSRAGGIFGGQQSTWHRRGPSTEGQQDDDAVSVAGSSISARSHGELKPPAEVLSDMDRIWALK